MLKLYADDWALVVTIYAKTGGALVGLYLGVDTGLVHV